MITINKYLTAHRLFRTEVARDFINFLRSNNALENFENNLNQVNGYDLLSLLKFPSDLIGSAFLWRNTLEGTNYWGDLNDRWVKLASEKYGTYFYVDNIILETLIAWDD